MDQKDIMRIFEETAYVRTGGSPEELRAAEYIARECKRFGGEGAIEPFVGDMATIGGGVFRGPPVWGACRSIVFTHSAPAGRRPGRGGRPGPDAPSSRTQGASPGGPTGTG